MLQEEAAARQAVHESNRSAGDLAACVAEVKCRALTDGRINRAVDNLPVVQIEVDGDVRATTSHCDRAAKRVRQVGVTACGHGRRELQIERLAGAGEDGCEVLAEYKSNAGVGAVRNHRVVQELELRALVVAKLLDIDGCSGWV